MFGFGGMTYEQCKQISERMAERDRRVARLVNTYPTMPNSEAYMRVSCEMEHEVWAASEEVKLKDIRENGT
jgi:hypothetical protein